MNKNRKLFIAILVCYIVLLTVLLLVMLPAAMELIKEELFQYVDVETVLVLIIALVCCLTMLVVMVFYLSQKITKSEKEKIGVSRMDDGRDYLEQQINELNKKLISSEDRLQEAYHLVLSTQKKQTDKSGVVSMSAFLSGFGIDVNDIQIQRDLAFILTPFHDDFKLTYEAVQKICFDMKLKPMRGDEEYIANDILKHIIKQVVKSRLVIAILDGRNPNVFYELGIVHSLNKPTILLANVNTKVPFDLQNKYLVLYENEIDLREKLTNALLNILTSS